MPESLIVGPVVEPDWVRRNLDRPGTGLVLADVRWYLDGRDGRAAHEAGHVPGAVWVDLDTELSAPPTVAGGRHPLPEPAAFARSLGALGVGDTSTVVAYDDSGGAFAARLVWMLRRIGTPAALLDGGLAAWGPELETGPVARRPLPRTPVPWPPSVVRSTDEVAAALTTGSAVVLDARAPGRYSGAETLPSDVRSGHVPGARNVPWAGNLTPRGTFVPVADLRERYAAAGVAEGTDVVVYCGSGVTACHDLLALEHAGVGNVALYPGSWSAWSADPGRPVATGEQ